MVAVINMMATVTVMRMIMIAIMVWWLWWSWWSCWSWIMMIFIKNREPESSHTSWIGRHMGWIRRHTGSIRRHRAELEGIWAQLEGIRAEWIGRHTGSGATKWSALATGGLRSSSALSHYYHDNHIDYNNYEGHDADQWSWSIVMTMMWRSNITKIMMMNQ